MSVANIINLTSLIILLVILIYGNIVKEGEMSRYNCFFEDVDYFLSVRLKTFIEDDKYGYFMELFIKNSDVLNLIKIGVRPYWSKTRDHFYIRVALNNKTKILMNGIQLESLAADEFKDVRINDITLKEISLSRYKNELNTRQCYCNKLICSARRLIKTR